MNEAIIIKEEPQEVVLIREDVRKVYPILEDLVVRSRAEQQVFEHESSYGYDKVTVEPIEIKLQNKEVIPNYEEQEIKADTEYDGLEKVTVKPKTGYETDDADVTASDIVAGKIAYNKNGRVVGTMTSSNNALISVTSNLSIYSSDAQIVKCLEKIELNISESSCLTKLFYDCNNLKSVKLIATDTYRPTLMSSVFSGCVKLQDISASINTENVTSFSECFFVCRELSAIPELKTENCSEFGRMFNGCQKLEKIPELDFSKATVISYMLASTHSLKELGGFKNLGKAYTNSTANYTPYTLDLSNSNLLQKQSLLNVINKLYNIAGDNKQVQPLILGTANLNKLTAEEIAIATAKGWTVS